MDKYRLIFYYCGLLLILVIGFICLYNLNLKLYPSQIHTYETNTVINVVNNSKDFYSKIFGYFLITSFCVNSTMLSLFLALFYHNLFFKNVDFYIKEYKLGLITIIIALIEVICIWLFNIFLLHI